MKINFRLIGALAVIGAAFSGGSAKAQNMYDILAGLTNNQINSTNATASQVLPAGLWTAINPSQVNLLTEVAYANSGLGNGSIVLGAGTQGGSPVNVIGAITGQSVVTGSGASTLINNGSMNTYANASGTFVNSVSAGLPDGTIGFAPPTNPFTWAAAISSTTVTNGTAVTTVGTPTYLTSLSSNNFVAYKFTYNAGPLTGQTYYILMFNLSSNPGSLVTGNYDNLVLEVQAAGSGGVSNPEPTSLALMGLGGFGLLGYKIRRRGKSVQSPEVAAS